MEESQIAGATCRAGILPCFQAAPREGNTGGGRASRAARNQALVALRLFFDALVQRHAVPLNSFASVRGVSYSGTEGETAEISNDQAENFSNRIDT